MTVMTWKTAGVAVLAAATFGMGALLHAQQPPAPAAGGGAQDQVAALKQSMQQGMALARKYEWVETAIISLKGEEKARKQNRCYYGTDGKVQKVSLDPAPAAEQEQGGRGGRRGGGKVKDKIVDLDKAEDTVTLAVTMNTLPDGARYAAQTTLEAKAKNITVVIQNSGHKLASR
jgi:hypothetical protein